MAWLRIDDGMIENPKISALNDREFRVYFRLISYCARTQDPTVDAVTRREVRGLTNRIVLKLKTLNLLDPVHDGYEVHDWLEYAPKDPTNAERQAKWRSRRNGKVTADVTEEVTDDLPF